MTEPILVALITLTGVCIGGIIGWWGKIAVALIQNKGGRNNISAKDVEILVLRHQIDCPFKQEVKDTLGKLEASVNALHVRLDQFLQNRGGD